MTRGRGDVLGGGGGGGAQWGFGAAGHGGRPAMEVTRSGRRTGVTGAPASRPSLLRGGDAAVRRVRLDSPATPLLPLRLTWPRRACSRQSAAAADPLPSRLTLVDGLIPSEGFARKGSTRSFRG